MHMMFFGLLLITSMLWAGNFVAGKYLVDHASSLTLTDLRWMIAIVFLLPIVWFKEKKLLPPKSALIYLFIMGLTGVVLFNIFMFLALERTSSNNAGLLSALNPVAIAIASFLIIGERISFRKLLGMMISFAGVLLVITNGQWERIIQFELNTGDLFMLAAVASWGVYSVAGRKAMEYTSAFMSTLWAGIFGVLVLFPINLPTFTITDPTPAFWIALMYVSVGATVVAMLFWNIGVQQVGGTKSGMFLNFNPIFTAIFAYFLLGETMSLMQFLGTAVVIGGVLLFTIQKSRPSAGIEWKKKEAS
ncbi:DMT family transporter [Ammoniphilus sp. CFH 90114]|uniref:DMT family transporter n=1 Tax=Ammoniphilus sp. CFH 90114 TaxID=2493665 RepID=UPI00100E6D61|nr:DMT family transporter [Ammoniphilus sp. CFH 90114]RXT06271.1 DMT family transporter [Ammoniphilus sp. CFH 90114]